MLMNNDNYLNSYLAFCTNFVNYNSPTQLYQSHLCTDFGIKRIAKLYKNHYDKFVSLGCISAMEIKWKETYIEYCKSINSFIFQIKSLISAGFMILILNL